MTTSISSVWWEVMMSAERGAVMGEVFEEWIDWKLMGRRPRGARQKRAEFTTFKMRPASGLQAFPCLKFHF